MPPQVLPAQPPINAIQINMIGIKPGQSEKSAVLKPVVVMTETTWKLA